jgi:hypothetical protein
MDRGMFFGSNCLFFVALSVPLLLSSRSCSIHVTCCSSLRSLSDTTDAGMFDKAGYLNVMGRTDDIINVAGESDPLPLKFSTLIES